MTALAVLSALPLYAQTVSASSRTTLGVSRDADVAQRSFGDSQRAMGTPPNVLILLADDLGVDNVGVYAEGADLPATPNLDALALGGQRFTNAYSHPVCSPSRAAIMTGRLPFRHGVGFVMSPSGASLDLSELTLPEMLDAGTADAYAHAAFGKWHLSNMNTGGPMGPNMSGFDHFSGSDCSFAGVQNYSNWTHIVNGVETPSTEYEPELIVDEAVVWMNAQTDPFLCYLSFNLPHAPYHRPPDHLHSVDFTGVDPDPTVEPRPYYRAMVEALDTLVGEVLADVDPLILADTVIIFTADNGTPRPVTVAPFVPSHAKTTVYEGGTNVPLIVSGAPVTTPGSVSDALVHLTDLFPTVAEAAGVDLATVAPATTFDGLSLYPYLADPAAPTQRTEVYSELFLPNGEPPVDPLEFRCADPLLSSRGGGNIVNLQAREELTCQEDLGFAGPGAVELFVCGPPLTSNASTTLTVRGAPPASMGWLFEGEALDPVPFGGGTIVPGGAFVNSYIIATDDDGFYVQGISQLVGLELTHYQAAFLGPLGIEVSNAVRVRNLYHGASIRNAQYKLIVDTYNCIEEFYDLDADPFEATNLLDGTLDPTQQMNYDELRVAFVDLQNS